VSWPSLRFTGDGSRREFSRLGGLARKALLALAAAREPVIVLTAPWHERDARDLVARLGTPVYAPPADTTEDLMEKYGVTAEQ
jgi:hypothetical protein